MYSVFSHWVTIQDSLKIHSTIFLLFARQIDINNCEIKIIHISFSVHRQHHHFSFTHTCTTTDIIEGRASCFVPRSWSVCFFFLCSALYSRFSGAQIFLLHSGELHGQSGLLSCHGGEENEEDEGCHQPPLWACSLCLGKWNLFVLSTCTPVVCSCQIRLSNQEASGRPRL